MNLREATKTLFIIFICSSLTYSAILIYALTPSEDYADSIEDIAEVRGGRPLSWECYRYNIHKYTTETIDLGITLEEFRASVSKDVMRTSTFFDPCGVLMVTPDDKYVQRIAEYLEGYTSGLSDFDRIRIILNFVQSAIKYTTDTSQYGDDFIAYPLETLFLGRGDCEDTSILLMSIYLAMGYDAVLLDFPTHVAVGVRWAADMDYYFCESARDVCSLPTKGLEDDGLMPNIYHIDTISPFRIYLNDKSAEFRNLVKKVLDI